MCSFFIHLSRSSIACRTAVSVLALCWISVVSSCYRNNVGRGEIGNAAARGDLAKVQALLKNNPDLVSSKGDNGNTPLHWAALNGHKDVAELLLANGANVNSRKKNGDTPLHFAAWNDHRTWRSYSWPKRPMSMPRPTRTLRLCTPRQLRVPRT